MKIKLTTENMHLYFVNMRKNKIIHTECEYNRRKRM